MTLSVTSPVTGAPMAGLTSPTYTLSADKAPTINANQWVVTALGGTQTNVEASSIGQPFTITLFKPASFKPPATNELGQAVRTSGRDVWKANVRKGVATSTAAGTALTEVMQIDLIMQIPVGAPDADANSVRAGLSLLFGALFTNGTDIANAIVTGQA